MQSYYPLSNYAPSAILARFFLDNLTHPRQSAINSPEAPHAKLL